MKFKSIYLKEGFFERKITFSDGVNLIYSKRNSCGKTTLLRFMLYALGYNIPNTKKIKFEDCEVELEIESEAINDSIVMHRRDTIIEVKYEGKKRILVLPEQKQELDSIIFGYNDKNIINNLLGTFYVDQEKGWTLLNRGVVIGSIHFNIEELIRGLSGIDCSKLINKEYQLKCELSKYKQMFSVSKYKEQLEEESGMLVSNEYEEEVNVEISKLLLKKKRLKKELKRIENTINDNKRFKEFVEGLKLTIKAPNGDVFLLKESNIIARNDIMDLLESKLKIVSKEYSNVTNKLEKLEKEKIHESEQLQFFEDLSELEIFDKNISMMSINQSSVAKQINKLNNELKLVRLRIKEITKTNKKIIPIMNRYIEKYGEELQIKYSGSFQENYLFTSNLKELSGAVLHKTVFSFRLAYIMTIKEVLKIKLPIILDSPSGKEVDQSNIKLMMTILKRDFSDHQIIIASIFTYDFDDVNRIDINKKLIEKI